MLEATNEEQPFFNRLGSRVAREPSLFAFAGDNLARLCDCRDFVSLCALGLEVLPDRTRPGELLCCSKKMEKKQLRESFVRTIRFISHNVRGLQKDEYVEEMLAWIRTLKGVYAACLQETWKLGDTVEENTGFVLLNHGPEVKLCKRGSLGVAILLSPSAQKAWEKAGSQVLHYGRRVIATRLSLSDNEGREVVVFLVSAYAPIGAAASEERAEYAQHLQACINECKEHELLVIGTDANAAVGVRSRHDDPHAPGRDEVRGQFGIEHQNNAGRELCGMLGTNELCLPSTFFQQTPGTYGTWKHPCSGLWHQCDHAHDREAAGFTSRK